jgi:hypothetical protein
MSRTPEPTDRPPPLPLAELFTRYLDRQVDAQARGLVHAGSGGEVEPYDTGPILPVDARLAWSNAVAACPDTPAAGWPVPPEWAALVAGQEPAVAVPFCLGNFPQLVRDLHSLVAGTDPLAARKPVRPLATDNLAAWARRQKSYPDTLLAAGVLRLAQHFDAAEAALGREEDAPSRWRPARANEAAALAWHAGRHAEALAMWQAQPASVPVLFNRGMALLFLGRPAEARGPLSEAVAGLPETSAWHHLGKLYLTLADASGS